MKRNNKFFLLLAVALTYAVASHGQTIMTLKECVQTARKNNIMVKNNYNDLQMALEQKEYARSKYYPMVGASVIHFEALDHLIKLRLLDQADVDMLSEGMEDPFTVDDFTLNFIKKGSSLGVTFFQPIYTGGRLTNYNKLADLQVDGRRMLMEVTDDKVVMATEFLYYKIVELHETDKTLDAMEKSLALIHQDAVNIYENGMTNKNDVLSVELMQDELSSLRIRMQNSCKLLRRALAKHIGIADKDIDVDMTFDADIVAPETLMMSTQNAINNRTETQLLDIWVEKSVLERKIAKANMLPVVMIGGRAGYSKLLSKWDSNVLGIVGVQIPISPFWSEKHEYKRKKIEEQKAIDFRKDNLEMMSLEIQDAYDNLESTYRQTQIAEKSVTRAEENLRICREHYRGGLSTMTVLLDAQRQQQQALTQRHSAISEYLQAKTRYLIVTGRNTY
ncbi:MAG: TolC family protein [Prevotella sp.]|nr:TolC family protein [Prevotella sp.]